MILHRPWVISIGPHLSDDVSTDVVILLLGHIWKALRFLILRVVHLVACVLGSFRLTTLSYIKRSGLWVLHAPCTKILSIEALLEDSGQLRLDGYCLDCL